MRAEKLDFVQLNYALDDRQAEQRLLPLAAEARHGRAGQPAFWAAVPIRKSPPAPSTGPARSLHELGADFAEILLATRRDWSSRHGRPALKDTSVPLRIVPEQRCAKECASIDVLILFYWQFENACAVTRSKK